MTDMPGTFSSKEKEKLLEEEGDIKIREEKVIRKTYYISLTEKGVSVAEQIRRISDVGSNRGLELSDAFKLIIYLHNDGP
jgi:DNA-binding PadR family transcriptional regulator